MLTVAAIIAAIALVSGTYAALISRGRISDNATASKADQTGQTLPLRELSKPRYAVVAITSALHSVVEITDQSGRVGRVVAEEWSPDSRDVKWSPDGSMLAWSGSSGLTIERVDGSDRRLLVPRSGDCTHVCIPITFAWSPDGKYLLVGGAGTQTEEFFVVSIDTGRRTEIAPASAYEEYAVIGWSNDRHTIAYVLSGGNWGTSSCCTLELFAARRDGSKPRRLFSFKEPIHDFPYASLSPDGRMIAFTTDGRDARDPRLAVVDIRSGHVRVIRDLIHYTATPAWSPDSRTLALARRNGVATVYADGTGVSSLRAPGETSLVAWTRDGDLIIASDARVLLSRDGKQTPRLLFKLPKKSWIESLDIFEP